MSSSFQPTETSLDFVFNRKVNWSATSCGEVVINSQEFELLTDRPILIGGLVPRRKFLKSLTRTRGVAGNARLCGKRGVPSL